MAGPKTAEVQAAELNERANYFRNIGDLGQAKNFAKDALTIREALYPVEHFPQGHSDLAISLNDLALIYHCLGDFAKAHVLYSRALIMNQAIYPPDKYPDGHPVDFPTNGGHPVKSVNSLLRGPSWHERDARTPAISSSRLSS
jgi:tetratricopeptide (TPR) repeat protein